MSWTAPPILASGATVTAADWNILADDIDVCADWLALYGAGAPTVGSGIPTPGTAPNYLLQAGTNSGLTVASNGIATFTLPTPFPNGILAAWANPQGGSYTSIKHLLAYSNASTLGLQFLPASASTAGNFLWGAIGW